MLTISCLQGKANPYVDRVGHVITLSLASVNVLPWANMIKIQANIRDNLLGNPNSKFTMKVEL